MFQVSSEIGDSDPNPKLSSSNDNELSSCNDNCLGKTGLYDVDYITGVHENGVVETPDPIESVRDNSEVPSNCVEFEPTFDNPAVIAMLDTEQSNHEEIAMLEPEQLVAMEPPLVEVEGPEYAYAVTQICKDGVVHPDAHLCKTNFSKQT